MNTVPFISFTSKAEEVDSLPFFVCAFDVFFLYIYKSWKFFNIFVISQNLFCRHSTNDTIQ